jgi:probable phosphoglycerate mutase
MRHGEVSYRRQDGRTEFSTQVTLTGEGAEQARQMRELLAQVPFDLGAHTGLTRTRQTAELVLEGRDVHLEEIGALRELQAGSIEHLSDERIDAEFTYGLERCRAARPFRWRALLHSGTLVRPSGISPPGLDHCPGGGAWRHQP